MFDSNPFRLKLFVILLKQTKFPVPISSPAVKVLKAVSVVPSEGKASTAEPFFTITVLQPPSPLVQDIVASVHVTEPALPLVGPWVGSAADNTFSKPKQKVNMAKAFFSIVTNIQFIDVFIRALCCLFRENDTVIRYGF